MRGIESRLERGRPNAAIGLLDEFRNQIHELIAPDTLPIEKGKAPSINSGQFGQHGQHSPLVAATLWVALPLARAPFGAGFAVLNKDQEAVLSGAVFDTNNTPTVSGVNTFFDNGITVFGSANLPTKFFGLPGHQGVMGTYSNGTYSNLQPTPYIDPIEGLVVPNPTKKGSWSLVYAFDQALYVSPDDPKRSWGLFGNMGLGDSNPNPFHWAANIGLGGSSPLRSRKQDTFGVGYFYTGVSDSLKQLAPRLLPIRDEQGVELFYNIAVTPWCHITPDLQVVNPALERANAVLCFGLRAKIDF